MCFCYGNQACLYRIWQLSPGLGQGIPGQGLTQGLGDLQAAPGAAPGTGAEIQLATSVAGGAEVSGATSQE